jgi:tRNA(Ile)-lysidine synthase
MLRAGDRVGVGVSGGADSVGLLLILLESREVLGIRLAAVHFNHRLRGPESEADERFVEDLARRQGLEYVAAGEDVKGIAKREGWNLEDAARRLRYGFFESLVKEQKVDRVAVGHTAEDQAETVLAHLIRGTGPAGLAGIYPVAGSVIRPLLEVRREELREFVKLRGEAWREDSTNQDASRTRVRIRKTLLPLLAESFQPAIVERLCHLAEFCRNDEAFWSALTEDRMRRHARKERGRIAVGGGEIAAPRMSPGEGSERADGKAARVAVGGRLVRELYGEVRGERGGLTAEHVARVIEFARTGQSGQQIELPGGVIVEREFEEIFFAKSERSVRRTESARKTEAAAGYAYAVEWGKSREASVAIAEIGVRLRLKLIDWPERARETKELGAALDAERLRGPLEVRNWRPGDSYRPAGHRRAVKVKEMFQRRRIGMRERVRLPLLTSGGEIVWGRGLPPAAGFAVRSGSKQGVVIAEERL